MDNDQLCLRVSVFTSTVLPTACEIEATTRSNMIPNPLSELKASLTLASKKKTRSNPPFTVSDPEPKSTARPVKMIRDGSPSPVK